MYLPPSTAGEEILHWNFSPLHRTLLYHPAGRKFAWNRSICYAFRDIDTFPFSAKIQDGRRKWRKMKFFPFGQDTLVSPCGSKNRSKSLDLLRFSRYWHFFIFRKKCKMAAKSGENWNFPPLTRRLLYHPAGQKFAQNRSISYGFRDIDTFLFSAKIQKGRQKWRKLIFYPFAQDILGLPCRSKIRSKLLYLLWFSRYSHFFIFFPLKSKKAAKSGENWNLSPLHRTLLYYPEGLNAIVFKLQVISLMMEVSEKSKSSYYSLIYWDRHPSYSPCCCCGRK